MLVLFHPILHTPACCIASHLHDHVQQPLPPLHVTSAHQGKADSRVEVGSRDVCKGVNCTAEMSAASAPCSRLLSQHGV